MIGVLSKTGRGGYFEIVATQGWGRTGTELNLGSGVALTSIGDSRLVEWPVATFSFY